MDNPLMSTIVGWGPSWAPRSWALCQGQLLSIAQYSALFALLGTTYGGDGRTTFGLPDLRGRVPIGAGQSPGTSTKPLGAKAGSETQTLSQLEMPPHNHTASTQGMSAVMPASTSIGDSNTPSQNAVMAKAQDGSGIGATEYKIYTDASNADTNMHAGSVSGNVTIGNTGGGQAFSIEQPFQVISFIIALEGIFPSRN